MAFTVSFRCTHSCACHIPCCSVLLSLYCIVIVSLNEINGDGDGDGGCKPQTAASIIIINNPLCDFLSLRN